MTNRGHALSRDALIRTLTAYSGITTGEGAAGGGTLVDTNLKDNASISPSGIPEKTILILSGDARGEDKGAAEFNNDTGVITLQGTGFSATIKAGTIYRILNISSTEIDVARIEAKVDIIDGVVDSIIADYLAHATYGLDAIKSLLNTHTGVLSTLDSRTAAIITNYLAHATYGLDAIKSLLNTHTGVLSTLDSRTAAIITNYLAHATYGLDAIKSLLNTHSGVLSTLDSRTAYIVTNQLNNGTYGLAALKAFLVALQAGTETLQTLMDELKAMIDMAKVPTSQLCVIDTEHTLTDLTLTNTTPMFIAGIWLGMENALAGDVFRWRVFVDWDGASIADQITEDPEWTFGGLKAGTTSGWVYKPLGFWVTYEIVVKVTQIDGTGRTVHAVLDSGARGS